MRRRSLRVRFEEKFERGQPDECWPWEGATNGRGYGIIAPPGGLGRTATDPKAKPLSASRVSYELYVGPIPPGLHIDHVKARGCSGPPCVNPAHLEPVTNAENSRRGAAAVGKLSPEEVEELRRLRSEGALLRELAERYGLSISRVHTLSR